MVDNNENIYVEFDCNNITLVNPNKVIDSEGKVKDRLIKHENLVMYANLQCKVLPRTKLLAGGDGQTSVETITVAEINFLNPGNKQFMDNSYTDQLTGKNSLIGKGVNQHLVENGKKFIGTEGVKDKIVNNGLLGITNITINQGLDFLPLITMELTDVRGQSMFEMGNNSPYAAFFNLPYPMFELTIKGYYGKAVKLKLMLQNFSSRYSDSTGDFNISLKFFTYKYTLLTELPMAALLAVPHMYKSRLKITKTTGGDTSKVSDGVVELGYQKIKEMYNEYKSKGLLSKDFPEITVIQMRDRIENFVKNILDSFTKQNMEPLNDIDKYRQILSDYQKKVDANVQSWRFDNIDTSYFLILKDKTKVFTFKKEIIDDLQKRQTAIQSLESIISEFGEKLSKNTTFGKGGKYTINNSTVLSEIPNPITLKTFNNKSINDELIDIDETYRAIKKNNKQPSTQEKELFRDELKNKGLLNFTDIVVNGKTTLKADYFYFDGVNSFNEEVQKIEKRLNEYRLTIQSSLTEALSSLLQSKDNGIGFVPTIRNVLAVFFASGEAFLRMMDDVHTKAWDVRNEKIRKSAILTKDSSVAGQDNLSSGANDETPIYPWPQYIIQTDGTKGHEKYEIAYPGDPKYVSSTKGYRYDVWPEIEFLEEFVKGLVEKNVQPEEPTEGGNLLNDIHRVSFDAIEYPISNDIFSNKEEIKYFYEIYERVLLHSNYPLLSRVMDVPASIDKIVDLFADSEKENILTSLSNDNPFLIRSLKAYGINSVNFTTVLRNISNGGNGVSWQNFIRGIFNTSYIKYLTTSDENGFVSSNVINSTKGQPLKSVNNEDKMIDYLTLTSNNFNFIDTFPFTNVEWGRLNMANGKIINDENTIFDTRKVINYNTNKKTITNFLETDDDSVRRPFTHDLTKKVTQPTINEFALRDFYKNREFKDQFVTEGTIRYNSYSGNVNSVQSVSMLNTPYFINSIQKGVENFRKYDTHPFTEAAYLFLNSLPLSTLKERYKTFNDVGVTELDYISSTLKKYGALHRLPYAFILKYGSIWYRYKKYINDGVDILDDVWKDFDSVTNYDPVTSAKTKNYNITINNVGIDFYLEKNTSVGVDSTTLMNVGFYPKLINDFNVFYQGYELFSAYTSTDITKSISSGLTFNYIPGAIVSLNEGFDPNNKKRDLKLIPWTMSVNSLDNISTFALPSEGSFINQSKRECLTNDGKLKIELSGNTSVYNGSVRLFWSAPNYGYYDNSRLDKPTPKQYFKRIITGSTEQENFSLNGNGSVYSDIDELFSVFDKDILDSFEKEFLLFSKSMYDYESSTVIDLKEDEHKFGNFQMLMVDMMKLQKITGQTSTDFLTKVQTIQLEKITSSIKNFINKDVYFKFGNPSRFNKKIFYSFSQRQIVDGYTWKSYSANSPNALPSLNNTITLSQSKANYPNEWKALETYIGFSTVDSLKYTDNGSFITDFFIDNDVQFTENNIIQLQQIIRIYATQKKKNSTYGRAQFIVDMEAYLSKNDSFMDKVVDSMMIKVRKDLPDVSNTPISSNTSELEGTQTKVELWESFKAMNDKWIAGGDFKYKTLFEDVLLIDRASRDIGDKILIDIYKLKTSLYDINAQASMYTYIDELIRANNFTIMNLPSYVNFYNVQDVVKDQKPKPEGTTDFANNLFGTFLNVDTRQSSPKLVCIYANKVSEQLAVDTDLTKRNDDAFEMDCGSPIIENQIDKKDWGTSNKIAAFNVDIGVQNQSVFYRLTLDQNNSLSTAESLQMLTQIANQASNRKGATQNVSLYNLYKIRSYTTSFSMMGNAMIQPSMYFNLRYVPMFSGPYMITSVQHVITAGNFETSVTGVRQPTASLPKVDEYIQVLKTNLLESMIAKNKENIATKNKETKDAKDDVNSQKDKIASNAEGKKELTENCTAKSPYDKFFNTTNPSKSNKSFKSIKDEISQVFSVNSINDDGKLKYVIFATLYIESGKDNGFTAYENNFAGIDLSSNWGDSIKPYIKQQFFCLTTDKTTLPYAQFTDSINLIKFLSKRWKDRMGGVEVNSKSIAKFWIENLSPNRTSANVYDSFDKTKLSNLETKIEKSIQTFNAI